MQEPILAKRCPTPESRNWVSHSKNRFLEFLKIKKSSHFWNLSLFSVVRAKKSPHGFEIRCQNCHRIFEFSKRGCLSWNVKSATMNILFFLICIYKGKENPFLWKYVNLINIYFRFSLLENFDFIIKYTHSVSVVKNVHILSYKTNGLLNNKI